MKRLLMMLLVIVMLFGLTACGGSNASGIQSNAYKGAGDFVVSESAEAPYWNDVFYEGVFETESKTPNDNSGSGFQSDLPEGVKMVYTADMELETTEYDKVKNQIIALVKELGGYLETQNSSNRVADYRSTNFTVRVPAAKYDEFIQKAGSLCSVTYQSQNAENISEIYYDTASRLETAKIKLDRLQELLQKADSMEDIIKLESAISEVEYTIENLSGTIRHYDSLVGYSTILVTLQEVYKVSEQETAPITFAQRIGIAFRDGLRNFEEQVENIAEWLAYNWVNIIIVVLIVLGIIAIEKRKKKKKAMKKAAQQQDSKTTTQQQDDKTETSDEPNV